MQERFVSEQKSSGSDATPRGGEQGHENTHETLVSEAFGVGGNQPWLQKEAANIANLLSEPYSGDGGKIDAYNEVVKELRHDLWLLRGDLPSQNQLLETIDKADEKQEGIDLDIGKFNPKSGTYDDICVELIDYDLSGLTPLHVYPNKTDPER